MGQLHNPGDAGAEADAVIGARNIIVHCLRYSDDFHAFFVQTLRITQRVIATNRNQCIDTEELEVGENLLSNVVDFVSIGVSHMRRDRCARQVTRSRARCMEKSATEPATPVHFLFGQLLHMLAIIGRGVGNHIHQPAPAAAKPDHLVPFPARADSYSAYRRIQPGHITSTGQNSDATLMLRQVFRLPKMSLWIFRK